MTVEVYFEGGEPTAESGTESQLQAAQKLRMRVLERESALAFEAFQLKLLDVWRGRSSFDADPRKLKYPSVDIAPSIEGVDEGFNYTIELDETLFAQFVGIYTTFGWSAIDQIRAATLVKFSPVGGVSYPRAVLESDIQAAAMDYVQQTLQQLSNLVYDSLVYLEQCLIESLTLVSGRVNEAFKTLRIERKGNPDRPKFAFSNVDHALANNIHFSLTAFARAYRGLLDATSKQGDLKAEIPFLVLNALAMRRDPSSHTEDDTIRRRLEQAQRTLAQLEATEQENNQILNRLTRGIATYFPAALPVCLMVAPNDGPTVVSNKLGQFYWALGQRTDLPQFRGHLVTRLPTSLVYLQDSSSPIPNDLAV